ncbi:hypothetical protein BD410DRAFT_809628 [Rickenella mellea]|uniref:Uncharacterized protein n=1 Tax=Rickenella mellea TaxID=50990 RepID=A0A4Y7PHI3_9AGAM|nr:hypothetical protein BD410DRAFT_809628 [Rickenella mellea]
MSTRTRMIHRRLASDPDLAARLSLHNRLKEEEPQRSKKLGRWWTGRGKRLAFACSDGGPQTGQRQRYHEEREHIIVNKELCQFVFYQPPSTPFRVDGCSWILFVRCTATLAQGKKISIVPHLFRPARERRVSQSSSVRVDYYHNIQRQRRQKQLDLLLLEDLEPRRRVGGARGKASRLHAPASITRVIAEPTEIANEIGLGRDRTAIEETKFECFRSAIVRVRDFQFHVWVWVGASTPEDTIS